MTQPPDVAALEQFDIIIKSPGISPYKQPAAAVLRAGVRFTSGSALWFAEHPHARTICVTGTKGKSTVTALIAHLLRKGEQRVGLAGNIGLPLLDLIAPPQAPDWWVIELSSFQTRRFRRTDCRVINNLTRNISTGTARASAIADKLAIARARRRRHRQQAELLASPTAIRNACQFRCTAGMCDNAYGAAWRTRVLAVACGRAQCAERLRRCNAACRTLVSSCRNRMPRATRVCNGAAWRLQPPPHRCNRSGRATGIEYINDSISTTPYATIEALRSSANAQ
jgi:UDP-N-acetylmuramoylalanine--D-glutamate ligase